MQSQDIRFYFSVFRQRLPYFLLPAVLVTAAGTLAAATLPSTYIATAKILVDSPQLSAGVGRSSVPTNTIEQLQVLEQELTTRVSLLAMAEKFGIYAGQPDVADAEMVNDMRARTSFQPIDFATPPGSSGAIAFAISFEASDPDLAAAVANGYTTAILEGDESKRRNRAAGALDFFKRDVDRLEAALNAAQDDVLRFKSDHKDALPDGLEFRRLQQSTYQDRLRQLEREEVSLQHRRASLEQIIASGVSPSAITADEKMLEDLQRTLAEQQSIFSSSSPNLQMLRARIQELENRMSTQTTSPTDISQGNDIPPELRVQLADIDGQIEFIMREKESIRTALSAVEKSIVETAGNATVLNTLERAYETAHAQHNEAATRLAEASMGQRIETEAIGQKLSLIEWATPPLKSVRPNRRAIAAGSLIMGVVAGLGLIVLIEFWAPTIRRPADLAGAFEGQPLETIPFIPSPGQILFRKAGALALVLALVASVPGFLVLRTHFPTIDSVLSVLPEDITAVYRM